MTDSGLPCREGYLPQIKIQCPRPKEQSGSRRVINRMEVLSTEEVQSREKTCFPPIGASPAPRRGNIVQNQQRPAEILILHLNSPSPEAPLLLPPIYQTGEALLLVPAMESDDQGQLSLQTTSDDLLSKATTLAVEVSRKTQPEEIRVASGAVRRTMRGLQPPVLPNHDVLRLKKFAGVHRRRGTPQENREKVLEVANGEILLSGIKRLKPSCQFKMSSEPDDELQLLDLGLEMEPPAVRRRTRPVRSCWNDPDLLRPQPPPSSVPEFLASAAASLEHKPSACSAVMMGSTRETPLLRPVTRRTTAFDELEPKPPAKSTKASSSIVKRRRVKKALPGSQKPYKEELSGIRALLKQCHERRGNSSRHLSHTMCPRQPLLERRARMDRHSNAERLRAPVPPPQRPQDAQRHRRRCTRLVGADGLQPLGQ